MNKVSFAHLYVIAGGMLQKHIIIWSVACLYLMWQPFQHKHMPFLLPFSLADLLLLKCVHLRRPTYCQPTQKQLFVYNLLTAVRLQLVSEFKPACLPSCVFRHKPAVNIWSGFDELVSRQIYIATLSKYRKILSVIWSHCDLKKKQTKCEQIEKQFSPTQQHIRIQIQERQLNRAMSCIILHVCWIIYRVLSFCMDFLMSGHFGISEPLNKQLMGQSEPNWHLCTECTRETLQLLCLLL